MLIKQTEFDILERRVRGLWASITSDAMRIHGNNEINYLMNGHATELVEQASVSHWYDNNSCASVYGVVAADRSEGRHLWLYLHYRYHLWPCHNLRYAIELIERIKVHNKPEQKLRRLEKRQKAKSGRSRVCCN